MRQIGTLADENSARTFEDFLLTRGVKSNVEEAGDGWIVWILDEDDVEQARKELDEYRENPAAEHFIDGVQAAADLRKQEEKERKRTQKQVVNMRNRWNRPMSSRAPVTMMLLAISGAVVAVGTDWSTPFKMCDRVDPILKYLYIAPIEDVGAGFRSSVPTDELKSITHGQVWRLITPIFLHFGPLHILFNMMWLRQLGAVIELRRGSGRYLAAVLLIAILSNVAQYISNVVQDPSTGPFFGGMSGVVFGLFGYIWIKSRYAPQDGFFMPPRMAFWMIAWFLICLTGRVGHIANTAHGVGMMVGMVIAYWPVFLRKLRR
jgi:GlpG protein